MVSWGTLSQAFYLAHTMEPENKHVVAALSAGLTVAFVLHEHTSEDVIVWLRKNHNQWHWGTGTSLLELLREDVPKIEAEWDAFALANSITTRGGIGEASYHTRHACRAKCHDGITSHSLSEFESVLVSALIRAQVRGMAGAAPR